MLAVAENPCASLPLDRLRALFGIVDQTHAGCGRLRISVRGLPDMDAHSPTDPVVCLRDPRSGRVYDCTELRVNDNYAKFSVLLKVTYPTPNRPNDLNISNDRPPDLIRFPRRCNQANWSWRCSTWIPIAKVAVSRE